MERRDSGVKMYLRLFSVFGLSEIATVTALAPLERLKLLRQTRTLSSEPQPYKGLFNYLSSVPRTEGFSAFWKGNVSNVIRVFVSSLVRFRLHYTVQRLFFSGTGKDESVSLRTLGQETAFGVLLLMIAYPIDLVRTRLATEIVLKGADRSYFGFGDCLGKTIKGDGIKGCYQGFGITAVTLAPYLALNPVLEEQLSPFVPKELEQVKNTGILMLMQLIFYPFDTVRRKLQVNGGRGKLKPYTGTLNCISQTMKSEGLIGFYAGLFPHMLRLAPSLYLFQALINLTS